MKRFTLIIVCTLLGCFFSACSCNPKPFYAYEGVWASETPFFVLKCRQYEGLLILNNTEMTIDLYCSHEGKKITICDKQDTENAPFPLDHYFWKADTKVKNNKLYLTVTEDKISNYEGKTIVLDFYTYEEWEALQGAD